MEAQLRFLADQGVQLIVTTGGLGPTADDLPGEVVAGFQQRPLELDSDMGAKIAKILEPLMQRFQHLDREAVLTANRKQAMVPRGATPIDPAGTAPGLVVPPPDGAGGPIIVVMPGPPRELHAMWPVAVETEAFQAAVAGRPEYRERMLRLFGIPESEIAETLRVAEAQVEGFGSVEITTCLRRAEVEVSARFEPSAEPAWEQIEELIAERHSYALFSRDGSRVRWPSCSPATGWRPRNPAPAACFPRDSQSGRARPLTWLEAWCRTPTRRRQSCSEWTPA